MSEQEGDNYQVVIEEYQLDLHAILALLSDVDYKTSKQVPVQFVNDYPVSSLQITIKCLSGANIPLTIESDAIGKTLFDEVENRTSVPSEMQMLSYKIHLLSPDISLKNSGVVNGCCIDLSVKGVGGGGDTDTGS